MKRRLRYETGVELGTRERQPGGGRIGNLEDLRGEIIWDQYQFGALGI